VSKLEKNTLLSELVLKGNPIYINAKNGEIGYVKAVLNMFPRLQKLDGIVVATWRKRIDEYHTSKLKGLFDRIDLDRSGMVLVLRCASFVTRSGSLAVTDSH